MSNTGDGDFEAIGKEFLGYFITLGGLTPDDAVLDVGSGIGRMAIPLASYLSKRGRYEGFDIVPEGVRWCQQHLTPRYPRFRFQVADVRNQLYNPKVTASATDYRFPFDDGTFDFCFCTSIFTHLLPDEVSHYLAEISRVLRPGGRCLATFFLAQDGACAGVESPALKRFTGCYRGHLVTDERIPEASITYREAEVRRYLEDSGLDVVEPLHYGSWSGREKFLSWQDVVVARKPSGVHP
jgi:SAM-dependent methyltransferase